MHPSVYSNIIYNQDLEATWVSTDRWVDKEDKVYLHNGILLSFKKNEILPSVTPVDLEGMTLSGMR